MARKRQVKSERLFEEAKKLLVGGVNSPVRAMKPFPFFTARGRGCKIYDVDRNSYIDYCLAYGPLILGHSHPAVVKAVQEQISRGSTYGTPTELEVKLARKICSAVPSAEMVRLVNTGTEATMGAIRLARGYTKRKKILKFEGTFHGAHDCVLVKTGSGASTHGVPNSLGIPEETTKNTVIAQFNDESAIKRMAKMEELACIILEPVLANMGCILPNKGYLNFLREVTEDNNILLIFDEVITGFRLCLGGAQEYYDVTPDITTLGKILGGGLPIGAIASSREIMEHFSPVGRVYQAGTFNGNPLSVAAGYATVSRLNSKIYKKLDKLGKRMRNGLEEISMKTKVYGVASMFQMYFSPKEVYDYKSALCADKDMFLKFQRGMLSKGIFLPPSQYECNFLSYAHGKAEVDATLEAAEEVLKETS